MQDFTTKDRSRDGESSESNTPISQYRLGSMLPSSYMKKDGSRIMRSTKLAIVAPIQTVKPNVSTPTAQKNIERHEKRDLFSKPYAREPFQRHLKIARTNTSGTYSSSKQVQISEDDTSKQMVSLKDITRKKSCSSDNLSVSNVSSLSVSNVRNSSSSSLSTSVSSSQATPPAHGKWTDANTSAKVFASIDATRNQKKRLKRQAKKKEANDLRDSLRMKNQLNKVEFKKVLHSQKKTLKVQTSVLLNVSSKQAKALINTATTSSTNNNYLTTYANASRRISSKVVTSTPCSSKESTRRICPRESVAFSPNTTCQSEETLELSDAFDVEMTDVSTIPSQEILNRMQEQLLDKGQEVYYLVVDTNVLLSNLKELNEVRSMPYESENWPHIYIPWVVLQELDRLKTSAKMKYNAIDAIKFINKQLTSKNPRFHGQSAKMSADSHKSYDKCNDDVILSSCIQLQKSVGEDKVVLLTNDRNLSNKAIVSELKTHTMETLIYHVKRKAKIPRKRNVTSTRDNDGNLHIKASVVQKRTPESASKNKEILANEKLEFEVIFGEIKMLLKCLLEPYFMENMTESFDYHCPNLLPKQPLSLPDILDCYTKYWDSVFKFTFPDYLLEHFQNIADAHDPKKACSPTAKFILAVLNSINTIFKELLKISPQHQADIEAAILRANCLENRCRRLLGDAGTCASSSTNSNAALSVFHHIWDLINYLCGMTMDFLGKPHNFVYMQTGAMPSKSDFQGLIANLYPEMHKVRKSFKKVLDEKNRKIIDVQHLYTYLVNFVPALQIQASPPPFEGFTIETLKEYCFNKDNESVLKNGYQQLETYFQKIHECIHDPIWKE